MKTACIIIGSYINAYSVVQELYENGVRDIYVLDVKKDVAAFSNKVKGFYSIRNNEDCILEIIRQVKIDYDKLVLYPTQDIFVEHLNALYDRIQDYCFLAFNPDNATAYQDKMIQYDFCDKLGVPCPKTKTISKSSDLDALYQLSFPILFKPTKRDNLKSDVFRVKVVDDEDELLKLIPKLRMFLQEEFSFIVSEVIPGDGSNIFAYTAYRNKQGIILGEWGGKKLSQFPNDYGVFSAASNEAPDVVLEQGRRLLHGMDLWGINEPEFKYDSRDGKYKLMEINLRPMMWHRVGALDAVPLNYIQYLAASGGTIPLYQQKREKIIHYVYEHHEWINLLMRKGYWKTFKHNLWGGDRRCFALFDIRDIKPFLFSFISIYRRVLRVKKRNK